ncbi:sialate O-acetylesterase [Pedobacter sp. BS3]|uniref:sialate O-acetylesterase n=1 Tax=Pedobacter sp. BS3 TaxID=2567937 RepID=UPI0011EE3547|nr:sialate O-acetylesterase [Pedobacter sp. BS3]TZF83220.1 sialate O-acetylesterase [Pedobacter sp. BS3]
MTRYPLPLYIILLLLFPVLLRARVKLPAFIGDNMVLQQQSQAKLWGWSKANSTVNIETSWDHKRYKATSDTKGSWTVKVSTPIAGGPYNITFNDGETLTLSNVMIGEVWFCSGQSNMGMPLAGNSSPILNGNEIILNADNNNLRLFSAGLAATLSPQTDCKGQWNVSTSETARNFSAIAYQYGDMLQKKLHVPVGLIVSSSGGTMIESWMSKTSLAGFPQVTIPTNIDTVKRPNKLPTTLFNGMIVPFIGFNIKGFIWYQGESNRHEPQLYGKLFPAMVADWRKRWQMGDLPFYYVQIAPFGSKDKTRSGPLLREAQLKAMSLIPNSGMASALDVGMEKDIHYMDKTTPAHRLGYWALGNTYGIKGIGYRAPMLKNMTVKGNEVLLSFDNAPYLTSFRKPLTLFEVAGSDKKFYPAQATIKGNQVTVKSDQVSAPVAVRYAFKEFVVAELYNNDGIPASSFRTDNWDEVR